MLALTLIARADPLWTLPPLLMRKAVAAALRVQASDANQWIGFVRPLDEASVLRLETVGETEAVLACESAPPAEGAEVTPEAGVCVAGAEASLGVSVRNCLRAIHAAVGFNFAFGTWNHFEACRKLRPQVDAASPRSHRAPCLPAASPSPTASLHTAGIATPSAAAHI